MSEIDTLFMTKTAENHTLWGCTNLYSLHEGEPPGSYKRNLGLITISTLVLVRKSTCRKLLRS